MNLRITKASVSIVAMICLSLSSGCGGSSKKPTGTGLEIPIKAWLVLAPGETKGSAINDGCRLTQAQINKLCDQILRNDSVFGPKAKFVWDGSVTEIVDPGITSRSSSSSSLDTLLALAASGGTLPSVWDSTAVNVYFGGNYDGAWASTLDPAAGAIPNIIINDGGGLGGGTDLSALRSRLTFEHEFAHFLARFKSRAFQSGTPQFRDYDSGEHVSDLPPLPKDFDALNNLLLRGPEVVMDTRVLNIPGSAVPTPIDELGEIHTRITGGSVLAP